MQRYRLSPEAQADLKDIRDFVAQQNPVSALALLVEMESCFELLAGQPLLGRRREELGQGLRSFVHRDYVLFYRPATLGIDVVRVLHGRRDLVVLF